MNISTDEKEQIQTHIVEAMIAGLDSNTITPEDGQQIAQYVLDTIEKVTTKEELLTFLRELSAKWNIFSQLLIVQSGELKQQSEKVVADNVLDLTKEGKIDEAIALAQSATTMKGEA